MKKRIISLLLVLCLCAALLPTAVFALPSTAGSNFNYIDEDGEKQTEYITASYILTPDSTPDTSWNNAWYAVEGNVTINETVNVYGNVHLILCDGATLTIKGDTSGIYAPEGNANLTVYAGKLGSGDIEGTGKLVVSGDNIPEYASSVTKAVSVAGQGIYLAGNGETGGKLTINGGTVEAKGGNMPLVQSSGNYVWAYSFGIQLGGSLTINGGKLVAKGGNVTAKSTADNRYNNSADAYSYGVNTSGKVIVNGGELEAAGGDTKASGGGYDSGSGYHNATATSVGILASEGVEVTKGTVTATGSVTEANSSNQNSGAAAESCGIQSGTLSVSGGNVAATGNKATANGNRNGSAESCGIYYYDNVTFSGGTVNASSGAANATGNKDGDTDATVSATACGVYGWGTLNISGGTLTTKGGKATAGSGTTASLNESDILVFGTMDVSGGTVQSDTNGGAVVLNVIDQSALNYNMWGALGTLLQEMIKANKTDGTHDFDVEIYSLTVSGGAMKLAKGSAVFGIQASGSAKLEDLLLDEYGYYSSEYDFNNGSSKNSKEITKLTDNKLAGTVRLTIQVPEDFFTQQEFNFNDITYAALLVCYGVDTASGSDNEDEDNNGLGGLIAILDDVPFVDVSANHYFYDSVKWAYHSGITSGTDAWHFSPDAGCTRAQIVTFLWRAAGCPSATYLGNFSDVDADAYYATAVAWAVENGITNGTSASTFSPEAVCTRADAVTFLYRAFGKNPNYTANFTDVPANAYFADAVAWAAENNVTGGTGNGKFSPADTCSRAQIVTFLYRTLG